MKGIVASKSPPRDARADCNPSRYDAIGSRPRTAVTVQVISDIDYRREGTPAVLSY